MAGLERGVRPIGLWSMSMTLSIASRPSIPSCCAGLVAGAVELVGQGPVQDVRHERALARARDAGHGHEACQREGHVQVLEVVLAGAADDDRLAAAAAARGRDLRPSSSPRRIRAGDRARLGQDVLERPDGDDLAAVLAGPGPDVDDPVRRADRLLVVLDHEHGVAQVAQPRERGDELGVVALVQPDRRLVQDVEHAHQARPDLGRQPDALGLAAGERLARPIERQVVQPDVEQEAEPGRDLLEDLAGDRLLALGQLLRQAAHELAGRE